MHEKTSYYYGPVGFRSPICSRLTAISVISVLALATNSGSMSQLLSLPQEVWRSIILTWLPDLGATARLDCACSFACHPHPLLEVYSGEAFPFPDKAEEASPKVLTKVSEWMRTKNVYISDLTLKETDQPLPLEWEDLICWSNESLQNLHLDSISNDDDYVVLYDKSSSLAVLSWAALHLKGLRKLMIEMSACLPAGVMEKILHNNSGTLDLLIMDTEDEVNYTTT